MRVRLWATVVISGLGAVLALLTLGSSGWVEQLFGDAPDNGNGRLEAEVVLITASVAVASLGWAFIAWRRRHRATRRRTSLDDPGAVQRRRG